MTNLNTLLQNRLASLGNIAYTENGAVARATTGSAVLDFFSQAGAYRTGAGADKFLSNWQAAFEENPQLAVRCLFYIRDVRGGQGERETFRFFMRDLAATYPATAAKVVKFIPEYGRWDDLLSLLNTPVESVVLQTLTKQLLADLDAERPSLLAKWLPSENASSAESKAQARVIRKYMGLSSKVYRTYLSGLRKKIGIIKAQMSAGKWGDINYAGVPSQANLLYTKAFDRHDKVRFAEYRQAVAEGKSTINASTQFPYEITRRCAGITGFDGSVAVGGEATAQQLDNMWNNQPDYFEGRSDNSICIVDVSSSMSGLPMEIAISLGIYVAERNKGAWHNKFIAFDDTPTLEEVKGDTILEKVYNVRSTHWGGSTNMEAVFDLILDTAVRNKVSDEDFVKRVFIVSDMEFNEAGGQYDTYGAATSAVSQWEETLFETISAKYKAAGYSLPELVFWNVRAAQTQFPMALVDKAGGMKFMNVSGSSPSIFKHVMLDKVADAEQMMLDVLNGERYAQIVI